MPTVIAIAAGGALGAIARHFFARWVMQTYGGQFPLGIMMVNILGAFLMGGLYALVTSQFQMSQEMRSFLMVGFLGAFTTFSTFALDGYLLGQRADWMGLACYVVFSVGLSMIALILGMKLGRMVLS